MVCKDGFSKFYFGLCLGMSLQCLFLVQNDFKMLKWLYLVLFSYTFGHICHDLQINFKISFVYFIKVEENRPFYSCVLSDLVLDWQQGWG